MDYMEYIKEEIQNRIKKLKSITITDIEEINFFEEKIKRFNKNDLLSISNINYSDFLLGYIRIVDSESSFKDIKNIIDPLCFDINESDFEIISLINTLNQMKEEGVLDQLITYTPSTVQMDQSDFKTLYEKTQKELEFVFSSPSKSKEFVKLYQKYEKTDVFDKLAVFIKCNEYVFRNEKIKEHLKGVSDTRKKQLVVNLMIQDIDLVKDTVNALDKMFNHVNNLQISAKKERNSINKKYSKYEALFYKISSSNKIVKFSLNEEDLEVIEDEEFKHDILLQILKRNDMHYQELLRDYLSNKNTEVNKLDRLLANYSIVITNDVNKMLLLENIDISNIEKVLKELNTKAFDFIREDEELFTKILLFSKQNIISNISNLYNSNVFTKEFIENNIGIFIGEEERSEELKDILKIWEVTPLYSKLSYNISTLSKSNILLSNIKKYDINLLLKDSEDLTNNLNMINQYGLDLSSTSLIDFSIVDDPKQLDVIDGLIELGLYEYVKQNTDLANKNINIIKKIILERELGNNIFNENNDLISEITEPNHFYIPDSCLDDYLNDNHLSHIDPDCYITLTESKNNIISNEIIYNPLITRLDNSYKSNDQEYNFDGIIISRNKVLRNMITLKNKIEKDITEDDLLISSVLFNSILEEKSISIVLDALEKIKTPEKSKVIIKETNN